MTPEYAIQRLNALMGGDREIDHSEADEILLACVPHEVAVAYVAAADRVGFWYA